MSSDEDDNYSRNNDYRKNLLQMKNRIQKFKKKQFNAKQSLTDSNQFNQYNAKKSNQQTNHFKQQLNNQFKQPLDQYQQNTGRNIYQSNFLNQYTNQSSINDTQLQNNSSLSPSNLQQILHNNYNLNEYQFDTVHNQSKTQDNNLIRQIDQLLSKANKTKLPINSFQKHIKTISNLSSDQSVNLSDLSKKINFDEKSTKKAKKNVIEDTNTNKTYKSKQNKYQNHKLDESIDSLSIKYPPKMKELPNIPISPSPTSIQSTVQRQKQKIRQSMQSLKSIQLHLQDRQDIDFQLSDQQLEPNQHQQHNTSIFKQQNCQSKLLQQRQALTNQLNQIQKELAILQQSYTPPTNLKAH